MFGVGIGRDFCGNGSLGSFLVWEDFRKFRKFGVFDFCWVVLHLVILVFSGKLGVLN